MSERKFVVVLFSLGFTLSSFMFGFFTGLIEEECKPQILISYYNPIYRGACELTKPRFNLKAKTETGLLK